MPVIERLRNSALLPLIAVVLGLVVGVVFARSLALRRNLAPSTHEDAGRRIEAA